MEITIHRGAGEIGGSCVQISSGGRSILLDAGSPLGESKTNVDLGRLSFNEVFISHPHKDHYGLIEDLDSDKPVYIGSIARELLDATRIFLGLPPLKNSFRYFRDREWIELGHLRVKPYLMDHSCVDAYGFLVEAEGKRIYYSGDFRAHGRKGKLFDWILSDPPRDVNLLLMEGTMMGRENNAYPNEHAVETRMLEVLHELDDRACFLICSGQHIDRLSAAFSACLQANRVLGL
jgi:ribonuclease J